MLRQLDHSPVTSHQLGDVSFYVKRDDLLHPIFSGNKARKFSELLKMDFSQTDSLISYGSAQANSLYSLAGLAYIKKVPLTYYVQHIPSWLKRSPLGNYLAATTLGADVVDLSNPAINPDNLHPQAYIKATYEHQSNCLIIPEGGRFEQARKGIEQLGQEIIDWVNECKILSPVVALPAGTGTTALFLQEYLHPFGIEVLTCACVGGDSYLRTQFEELNGKVYPTILTAQQKHHFGQLYLDQFDLWEKLKIEADIEFDLLYDPLMWQLLLPWIEDHPHHTLLYIHQGGLLGNKSMEKRYRRKLDSHKLHHH